MTIREQVIEEIKVVSNRKNDRLSKAAIAREAGVSVVTFSRWISGKSNMTDNNIEKICGVLGIKFIKINKNINV